MNQFQEFLFEQANIDKSFRDFYGQAIDIRFKEGGKICEQKSANNFYSKLCPHCFAPPINPTSSSGKGAKKKRKKT